MTDNNQGRTLRPLKDLIPVLGIQQKAINNQARRAAIPGLIRLGRYYYTDATDAELQAWNAARPGSGRPPWKHLRPAHQTGPQT